MVAGTSVQTLEVVFPAERKLVHTDRHDGSRGGADHRDYDAGRVRGLGADEAHPERNAGVDDFVVHLLERACRLQRPGDRKRGPCSPEKKGQPDRRQDADVAAAADDGCGGKHGSPDRERKAKCDRGGEERGPEERRREPRRPAREAHDRRLQTPPQACATWSTGMPRKSPVCGETISWGTRQGCQWRCLDAMFSNSATIGSPSPAAVCLA